MRFVQINRHLMRAINTGINHSQRLTEDRTPLVCVYNVSIIYSKLCDAHLSRKKAFLFLSFSN